MKDIELPPLPEPDICRYVVTVWRDGVECEIDNGPRYTVEQMQSYARAAVEADRAQRVPDGWKLVPVEPTEAMKESGREYFQSTYLDTFKTKEHYRRMLQMAPVLASTPAQPAQQEPDCPRCNGSGEDPEGYFDQSRGPDGDTHDGPCRDCAGTGAAPQPVERKPMTDAVIRERARLYLQAGRSYRGLWDEGVELASRVLELGFIEGAKAAERHQGIRE